MYCKLEFISRKMVLIVIGSQYVGMAKHLFQYPEVMRLFQQANEVLGFNLLKLCLEGPVWQLDNFLYGQPATYVTSFAAATRAKIEHPEVC